MANLLLKTVVQTIFLLTSRDRVRAQTVRLKGKYNSLAKTLTAQTGAIPVQVPSMQGVDENMRNWSFFQLLQHNRLVNEAITAITVQLAKDLPLSGAATINPATDVLPSDHAGIEELERFNVSIDEHLRNVASLVRLRGTRTTPHPMFGTFDAHNWNCMFAFHLHIHLKQAITIIDLLPPAHA